MARAAVVTKGIAYAVTRTLIPPMSVLPLLTATGASNDFPEPAL